MADKRNFPAAARWITVLLLAAFAVQAVAAAARDSVTIDEFSHLAVGLYRLLTGDFRHGSDNPNLPRLFAALPLLLTRPAFAPPPDPSEWTVGYQLMQANPGRYQEIYFAGRMMIILLSLATAALTARWAFELYGTGAALASLFLFAFSPSLLAHGHLVTNDMAGAFGFLLALYAAWRFLDAPTWRRAALVGLAAGLANLLKLSAPALAVMVLAVVAVRATAERRGGPPLAAWLGRLALMAAAALLVVNAGYGFVGTLAPLREGDFPPNGRLTALAASMPELRLPLPLAYLEGLDKALAVGKDIDTVYYLAGRLSSEGFWYYHLVAFAAKCPLPVLLAAVFAVAAWAAGRAPGRRVYAVFVPVLLLFAVNASFNSLNIGERHVLAAYPLLFIGISPWVAAALSAPRRRPGLKARATQLAAALALLWTAAGTIAVAPRYLQYFNEAAGGPENGHRLLVDSNLDWGQDLLRLRDYMRENRVDTVALAYFGRVNPGVYGIRFTPLVRGVSRGKAAVSASFLMGRPYYWFLGRSIQWVPPRTYVWLQGLKPVARVGSMFVYDIP